jgi:hypothetical protein
MHGLTIDHSLYTIYVTLFIPDLFLRIAYKWHCSTSSSTSQPLDMFQSLHTPSSFAAMRLRTQSRGYDGR